MSCPWQLRCRLAAAASCARVARVCGLRAPRSGGVAVGEVGLTLLCCSRRESYGRVSGGCSIRSRTSVAYSGESDATMYSNFVLCAVIPRVENWASTCAMASTGAASDSALRHRSAWDRLGVLLPWRSGSRCRGSVCVARRGHHLWVLQSPGNRPSYTYTLHLYILLSRAVECSRAWSTWDPGRFKVQPRWLQWQADLEKL